MVKINDNEKFKRACEKMRYFEIDGKPCRALPFDKDLLGTNKQKIETHNLFVRRIPSETKAPQLEETFSKFGDVKSVKISLNADHTSRQYGFVCFQEADGAA
jgi:polyadenylate-binding protein